MTSHQICLAGDKRMRTLGCFSFFLACCVAGASHGTSLGEKCLGRAPGLTESFVSGDYAGTNRQLGPTMRLMFSPETLKGNWEAMTHHYGAYVSHGTPVVFQDDGKDAFIRVPMAFSHGDTMMQIVCSKDSGGQVDSLAFL
jgi:hypothetical protein